MRLYGGVVATEELVGRSHHVDLIGFSLGTFLVHVLVDRLIERGGLKDHRHDQKERSPQLCGSSLGDAAAVHVDLTGLVRRGVNACECNQANVR